MEPLDLSSRADWFRAAPHLLAPYLAAVERGIPGSDGAAPLSGARPFARWFENLIRPLALAAPCLAGAGEPVLIPMPDGRRVELASWYRDQWAAGVGPGATRPWRMADRTMDQTVVETSLLTVGLVVARAQLWDPLPRAVQDGLADWLNAVSHQLDTNINNWNMFPVITQLGLGQLGRPVDRAWVQGLLGEVEKFYHADGWYADGFYRQFDYYVPEAIYLLILAAAWSDDDAFRRRIGERAARFARDYALFFDVEGRNIVYGRSRSYRFSASYFFALCAWAGVPGVEPGRCRGLIARNIAWYLNRDVFGPDGRLWGGVAYLNERANEVYIGPGSGAWAFQSFLPMALPPEHPFWTAPEPPPEMDRQRHLPAPNFVITRDAHGRNATLYNGGSHHPFDFGGHPAKYGKFTYSSHFGFNLADAVADSADHMISLRRSGGGRWSHRYRFELLPNQDGWMVSRHQPFEEDGATCITTALLVRGPGQVRVHLLELAQACEVREGGTPVAVWPDRENQLELEVVREANGLTLTGANGRAGGWMLHGDGRPALETFGNVNVLHRRVGVPLLGARLEAGTQVWVSAWHADAEASAVWSPPVCRVEGDGGYAVVWPDGQVDRVRLEPARGRPHHLITGGGFSWPP